MLTKQAHEKARPFIRYPTNKLFAVINQADDLRLVLDDLANLGLASDAIETFCGEKGIKRIDAQGREHNLRGRIIRTVQQLGQEGKDVRRYEQELAAGYYLISIFAPADEVKNKIIHVLKKHNANQINLYGTLNSEKI